MFIQVSVGVTSPPSMSTFEEAETEDKFITMAGVTKLVKKLLIGMATGVDEICP